MHGWLITAASLAAIASPAGMAQDAGGSACVAYEYPIQVWRSDARRYNEVFGLNRFARLEQCEAARAAEQASSDALVNYVKRLAPKARIEKWNFLECRCDRTRDSSSPHYLDESRREVFVRIYQAGRFDIWEEALDKKMSEQSDMARQFNATPRNSLPSGAWPLVVAVPEESDERLLNPAETRLRPTTVQVSAGANGPALDHLKLVEIDFGDLDQAFVLETVSSSERSAVPFVEQEIGRIQSLLPRTFEVEDEEVRDRLIEVLQQRMQLLSNLDRIIASAPPSSAIAARAAKANTPDDVNRFITDLFGSIVGARWSPAAIEDTLINIPTHVADDPLVILRSTDPVEPDTRGLALYAYLMRTPVLTENEEIWLSGLFESMLGKNRP